MPEHRALGLAQDETIVRDHDPRWAAAYDAEATRLRLALDETPVVVEHIGSTAVPGLAAKPILDIAAGYSDLTKMNLIHTRIESLDYVFHGDQGDEGGMLFIKGSESSRTHYLHGVAIDSPQWSNYLGFRDALRASPELRGAYAALKKSLAAQFPHDRLSYLDGKAAFINKALRDLEPSSR